MWHVSPAKTQISLRNLIRVFDGRCMGSQRSNVSLGDFLRLIRVCGCADWFGPECNRCMVACVHNEESDQPVHSGILIRVFDGRCLGSQGNVSSGAQLKL